MFLKLLMIISLTLGLTGLAQTADLSREKRIAEQIEEAILDGDPVYLKDGEHEFLSIFMRSEAENVKGAVILMHGHGANPDWIDVIQPLRIGLTEYGWDTLSIQLPVAREGATDKESMATIPEAAPRIEAALAYLKQNSHPRVVLVSHSFGSSMAAAYLANKKISEQIQGFVSIGMSADMNDKESGNLAALRKIKLPIYDIYGERDLKSVLESASERKLAARDAENTAYRQNLISGADHFFAGLNDELLATVRAWLFQISTTQK